jgi:hypothetical protein
MAVAVVQDFEGATLEQYDQVVEKMQLEPGGAGAPGGLFHWVTDTPTGIRITDVWHNQATFEQFAAEHILPTVAEVGVPNPPTVTFHQVHNYFTEGDGPSA